MIAVYAESSAILAWLLGESNAGDAVSRMDEADMVVTSVLTVLEIERALIRAGKLGLLGAADCQKLRGLFARTIRSWMLMEVSEDVRAGAGREFPVEPVRTLDALHLSTALQFVKAFPELRMLTFDQRIEANSRALGLA